MKMDGPDAEAVQPVKVESVTVSAAEPVSVAETAPPLDAAQRVNVEPVRESVVDEARVAESAAPFPALQVRSVTLQLAMVAEAPDAMVIAEELIVIAVPEVADA